MEKLTKELSYKITYGKAKARLNGDSENWIGISIYNNGNTEPDRAFRIKYLIQNGDYKIYNIVDNYSDFKVDVSVPRFYFVYPLQKLIEKAMKTGSGKVFIMSSYNREINHALSPFTIGKNEKLKSISEEKIKAVMGIIETIANNPSVWKINNFSDIITFRTKAGQYMLNWSKEQSVIDLYLKDAKVFWQSEKVAEINTSKEMETFLNALELKDTFKDVLVANITRALSNGANPIGIEIKEYLKEIESVCPIEEAEKELLDLKPLHTSIYGQRVSYYKLKKGYIVNLYTKNLGEKIIIAGKDDLESKIRQTMIEDLKTEDFSL